jgi:hypothetical protein
MPDAGTTPPIWLAELRRPFPPEAIKFKGQAVVGGTVLCVPYIDARLVIERLNHVCGMDWQPTYEPLGKSLWCHLTIGETTRSDLGSGYEGKGLVSDALKRAAVLFGIGVSVYASPSIWLSTTGDTPGAKVNQKGNVRILPEGEKFAREQYGGWLEKVGTAEFGEPLGHGAVVEAAGLESDEQTEDAGPAQAAPPALLVDVEADTLRQAARTIYEEIRALKGGRTRLPPARFQEGLTQASTSHDDLRTFLVAMRALVDELKAEK